MVITLKSVLRGLTIAFTFLSAMNFDAKFFYFAFAAFLVMVLTRKSVSLNDTSVLYILLGLLMGGRHLNEGVIAVMRFMAYIAFYLVGYLFLEEHKTFGKITQEEKMKSQKASYNLLMAVAWGSFAHFMLNYLINLGEKDVERNTIDVWSGRVMAATGQAALSCIMIGVAVSMILLPKKKYQTVVGIVAVIGILAYNMILAGRTVIVQLILALAAGLFFLMLNGGVKHNVKSIIVLGILVAFLVTAFNMNWLGMQEKMEDSNLYDRFSDTQQEEMMESGRGSLKMTYLKNFFVHPFGGGNMRAQVGFAHDLLLDAHDEYGIFVTILLVIILFEGLKELYIFCKNKNNDLGYRLIFLCVYSVILMEFCVEPIFAGIHWLFVCYCMLNGCIAGMNRMAKRAEMVMK